jgi:hypothetical protein
MLRMESRKQGKQAVEKLAIRLKTDFAFEHAFSTQRPRIRLRERGHWAAVDSATTWLYDPLVECALKRTLCLWNLVERIQKADIYSSKKGHTWN